MKGWVVRSVGAGKLLHLKEPTDQPTFTTDEEEAFGFPMIGHALEWARFIVNNDLMPDGYNTLEVGRN